MESATPRPPRTVAQHVATLTAFQRLVYAGLSVALLAPYVLFWFIGERDAVALGTMAVYTYGARATVRALWRGDIY
jgi:hypothetical protein